MDAATVHSLLTRDLLDCRTTAEPEALNTAREKLLKKLPERGLGDEAASDVLLNTIVPALAAGQAGPRYFGFVTGGRTPISLLADVVASSYDSNVQVHLPNETISTYVESLALNLVLDLLDIPNDHFQGRTISTGATSSNVLGLAVGRQAVVARAKGDPSYSVAEDGMGGVEVDVLAVGAHASIRKGAALVGIGRSRVREVGDVADLQRPVAFDVEELETLLKKAKESGRGAIVCPAYGEVNTGAFTPDMLKIRQLCDKYNAWIHLDAAFGGFGALHPDFAQEVRQGMELADSLTLDGHKWLNVPYDCGLFYTRSSEALQAVCGPGGTVPSYLSTSDTSIPSPLNVSIENSRRFRALPLYCSLLSLGKEGYRQLVVRNIEFARRIEAWLQRHPGYDVLTPRTDPESHGNGAYKVLNIVLFAASDECKIPEFKSKEDGGMKLCARINESGEMYCTGTKWMGRSAVRLAVSNWQTGLREEDYEIVINRLERIMQ